MPASARKSSISAVRRGLQKAHIPYRGDNPEVGKKTGIAVQHVERKSDGFEPFAEVMQQADGRTPPRPKRRKKSVPVDSEEEEEDYDADEYGEMSMQLDSPVQTLTSVRPPTTPTNNGRGGSRPVARSSNVDFDKIPSPRPRSMANGGPGPSRLSRSIVPAEVEPSSEANENSYDNSGMQDDGGGDFDDYGPQEGDDPTPRRTSFTQIDEDDDEDEEQPNDQSEPDPPSETPVKQSARKSKGRHYEDQEDEEMIEDDIARDLSEVGQQSDEGEEEEEEEPQPQKKAKVTIRETKPPTKTRSRAKKENQPQREGVRRSTREHYKPLDYWRGEKVVYGRPDFSAPVLVPHIREIIRIPKDQPAPLGQKRKRARSRSRTTAPTQVAPIDLNPEEGWDDITPSNATIIDYRNSQEVERRIAWTSKMVHPEPVANAAWSYQKIFGDADFIAAGQLVIPPKSRKPSKATKDNTYIFYIIEGAINLKIHDTSLVLASGAMFMVPRGNTYFIENISQRDAKLFFTQARKTMNDEDERIIALANRQRRKTQPRSSSAGPISGPNRLTPGVPPVNGDAVPLASRAASMKL